ncbi:hypothetical protein TWF281_011236 [Arthrobotrys megalospora]
MVLNGEATVGGRPLKGPILSGLCRKGDEGERVESSIDLDRVLGNHNGRFVWGFTDFSKTARNIRYAPTGDLTVEAELQTTTGTSVPAQFRVEDKIQVVDGVLTAKKVPAVLVLTIIPYGV